MRLLGFIAVVTSLPALVCAAPLAPGQSPTAGVEALVKRRLPDHINSFEFVLQNSTRIDEKSYDAYVVSSSENGKIRIEGGTTSALLSG